MVSGLGTTLYELKQIPGFREYYRIPYYIKNTINLLVLAACLFFIHLVYFRVDGGSLAGTLKMLRGMSSATFNYLEAHQDDIHADYDKIKRFNKDDAEHMNVLHFQSDCLSKN